MDDALAEKRPKKCMFSTSGVENKKRVNVLLRLLTAYPGIWIVLGKCTHKFNKNDPGKLIALPILINFPTLP